MEPPTVRCPNCQKKQREPYPQRCGCGQSLLAVLAAHRREGDAPAMSGTSTRADRAWGEAGENEW